jgi:hypothetical protein
MDAGFAQNATDRNLRAWLSAGPVDRSVGDGLTFVASAASAQQGKGSWVLRFRFGGRQREKSYLQQCAHTALRLRLGAVLSGTARDGTEAPGEWLTSR